MSETILYNEEELLRGFSAKEEAAFRSIFELLAAPLHYFARRLIADSTDAEDIVSIAFHKLWETTNKFESLKSLRSYLYITVRRQCIDRLRHQAVVQKARRDLFATQDHQTESLDNEYIQAELLRLIYEEIKMLPEKYRTILEWTYLLDLTTAEMAVRLGSTENHIRADRSRGLQLLRKALHNRALVFTPLGIFLLETLKG